jgi:RNA polymerase sigma-70 factor, ECF subfamily
LVSRRICAKDRAVVIAWPDMDHKRIRVHPSFVPASILEEEAAPESGIGSALGTLYRAHFDMVFHQILRSGVPTADAEDLAQQVFLVAHKHLKDGTVIDNPGGWLRGVALRVVADHFRWRKVRRLKEWILPGLPGAEPQRARDPEADTASAQAQAMISEVLAEMSSKLRDTFVLLEVEQVDLETAAAILGCPANTVRSRRRLAQEAFRRAYLARTERGQR